MSSVTFTKKEIIRRQGWTPIAWLNAVELLIAYLHRVKLCEQEVQEVHELLTFIDCANRRLGSFMITCWNRKKEMGDVTHMRCCNGLEEIKGDVRCERAERDRF